LIVNHAEVDVTLELFSSDAGIHRFIAVVIVTSGTKLIRVPSAVADVWTPGLTYLLSEIIHWSISIGEAT
jgi:hypothetical protein